MFPPSIARLLAALVLFACISLLPRPVLATSPAVTHILWTNTNGSISVWTVNADGSHTVSATFGPYAGWTAKALADGADGNPRILWTNGNGQMSLWDLNTATGKFTQSTFGPYSGWTATDIGAGDYLAGAGLTLTGNQFAVAVPLSLSGSSSSPILSVTNTGAVGDSIDASSATNYAVSGSSGSGYGVYGTNRNNSDYGFLGGLDPTYNAPAGVFGKDAGKGNGVLGVSAGGSGSGVAGVSDGGVGVLGNSTSNDGVQGNSASSTHSGVAGVNTVANGMGVYGVNRSTGDYGFLGGTDPKYTAPAGVFGKDAGKGNGVLGVSAGGSGSGVAGVSDGGVGIYAVSTSNDGVQGNSASSTHSGVAGVNTVANGMGVYGVNRSSGDYGILGGAEPAYNEPAGVFGNDASSGPSGSGVCGNSVNGYGVSGSSASIGVFGEATGANGSGVLGDCSNGYGVYGSCPSNAGYAGYFSGNMTVTGAITAGTKDFKIDHPLDPTGKYLYHASVESNQMKDIYDGDVTTDAQGNATVTMPGWFGALNTDFHYQLTCIGQFAQAIVATKIQNNQFTVKTDKPNVEVSWQVTGVRHDAFALSHPLQVEQDKPASEQGQYQNPEAFGQPKEMGIDYAQQQKMKLK